MHPLIILALIALMTTFKASANAKEVLIIETLNVPIVTTHTEIISERLTALDPSIKISVYDGNGQANQISEYLQSQLECDCFDLLITNATLASKVGKRLLTGQNKPMVFVTVADPVGAGLVENIGEAGNGFVTGRIQSVRRGAKFEIMNQLISGKEIKLGLVSTDYPSAVSDLQRLENIAQDYKNISLHKRVIAYKDGSDSQIEETFENSFKQAEVLKSSVDYFWAVNGPLSERNDFALRIAKLRPLLYGANLNSVKQGALFTVIPDPVATGSEVAQIVFDILNGKPAGSIEVRAATQNILAFNLATATRLDVVVPFELLNLAGKNIYR